MVESMLKVLGLLPICWDFRIWALIYSLFELLKSLVLPLCEGGSYVSRSCIIF